MQKMQTKRELKRQRKQRISELKRQRKWIHKNPQQANPAAIDFVNNSIAELNERRKMKNTLRPGKVLSLRTRLKVLLLSILTQTPFTGK